MRFYGYRRIDSIISVDFVCHNCTTQICLRISLGSNVRAASGDSSSPFGQFVEDPENQC